ncbi:Metallophosphoesterase [Penicillium camemberti]|uniref:Metallophosphoesterase n=1 Tax=Penicillium camemberti (strain FM 013) TaxID=1429867 RepID=A0A0G4P9T3_PENC3|nr:Metallophosphoesterase [Penicillium camemberti]
MAPMKSSDKIFPITTFISDLPTDRIPQSLSPSSEIDPVSGRLVIVGDVHGMRKSLETLLDKVSFDKSKGDHLILVGDLVNKGPDSSGVVDLAIKLGASAVRGNHENAVLNAAAEINATRDNPLRSEDLTGNPAVPENPAADLPGDNVRDLETADKPTSTTTGATTSHSTASVLSTRQLDWLAALPLILRVKLPHVPTSSLGDTLIVVHAGLVPGISLENQDHHAVMHIRSVVRASGDEAGFVPAEISGEESWVMEWDRWQDSLASKTTVIFGHDARRRLQLGRYAIGLDSACLYGHQLSAVVIAASDTGIEHQVVQVECADASIVPTVSVNQGDKAIAI